MTETMTRIRDAAYERADRDSIKALQLERLRAMLEHVAATNSFYRDRWRAAGVDVTEIGSLEEFSARVPMVEKRDFVLDQEVEPPFGSRLRHAMELGDRVEVYTTSGTTGQGVEVHLQTEREIRSMVEMYGFHFAWAGLKRGDQALLTLPLTMFGGGRIEWQGAVGYGLTVYPAGNYDAAQKLQLLQRFRPKAIYGSTSYFGHLAAVSETLPPCSSIEVLLTGLEGVGYSFLEQLQQQWNAKAFDRFGCTQMRSDFMFTCEAGIGSSGRRGLLHNLDPFVLTEVIDPETGKHVRDGEFGEIVVTSLYHWDTPVVRNRLRDGGVWHPADYCGCGRPFDGLEVVSVARTDDLIKVKGVLVYPQAVDDTVFSFSEVDEYHVVVTSSPSMADVLTVEVMPKQELSDEQASTFRSALGSTLKERIGLNFDVTFVDSLPRSEYKARRWRDERAR